MCSTWVAFKDCSEILLGIKFNSLYIRQPKIYNSCFTMEVLATRKFSGRFKVLVLIYTIWLGAQIATGSPLLLVGNAFHWSPHNLEQLFLEIWLIPFIVGSSDTVFLKMSYFRGYFRSKWMPLGLMYYSAFGRSWVWFYVFIMFNFLYLKTARIQLRVWQDKRTINK